MAKGPNSRHRSKGAQVKHKYAKFRNKPAEAAAPAAAEADKQQPTAAALKRRKKEHAGKLRRTRAVFKTRGAQMFVVDASRAIAQRIAIEDTGAESYSGTKWLVDLKEMDNDHACARELATGTGTLAVGFRAAKAALATSGLVRLADEVVQVGDSIIACVCVWQGGQLVDKVCYYFRKVAHDANIHGYIGTFSGAIVVRAILDDAPGGQIVLADLGKVKAGSVAQAESLAYHEAARAMSVRLGGGSACHLIPQCPPNAKVPAGGYSSAQLQDWSQKVLTGDVTTAKGRKRVAVRGRRVGALQNGTL